MSGQNAGRKASARFLAAAALAACIAASVLFLAPVTSASYYSVGKSFSATHLVLPYSPGNKYNEYHMTADEGEQIHYDLEVDGAGSFEVFLIRGSTLNLNTSEFYTSYSLTYNGRSISKEFPVGSSDGHFFTIMVITNENYSVQYTVSIHIPQADAGPEISSDIICFLIFIIFIIFSVVSYAVRSRRRSYYSRSAGPGYSQVYSGSPGTVAPAQPAYGTYQYGQQRPAVVYDHATNQYVPAGQGPSQASAGGTAYRSAAQPAAAPQAVMYYDPVQGIYVPTPAGTAQPPPTRAQAPSGQHGTAQVQPHAHSAPQPAPRPVAQPAPAAPPHVAIPTSSVGGAANYCPTCKNRLRPEGSGKGYCSFCNKSY